MRLSLLTKTIIIISFISLIWSCKKEPDLLGLDLIPEEELLNHDIIDTITIIARTEKDTLLTKNTSASLLGSIEDLAFGRTSASFYTQFLLPEANHDFGDNPIADSIFLTLPYRGIYGDSNAVQTVRIYEVTDTLSQYVNYFQYSTLPVGAELIGEATFVPNLKDSIYIDSVKTIPMMRIPLSIDFANRLMNPPADTTYKNNTNFIKTFKGLYFVTEDATGPGSGAIMYMNLLSEYSRIHLYYRYDAAANDQDTTKFVYVFSSSAARFNHYDHDYAGADPALLDQFAGNSATSGEKLFLQSMAGTKLLLEFPHLDKLAGKNLAIHEAELVFKPIDDEDNVAPLMLNIKEMIPRSLVDTSNADLSYFVFRALQDEEEGATHILGNLSNDQYKFRITRYVQDRLLHPDDPVYPLAVYISGANALSNSAVIKGTEAGSGRFKLVLYLTPMN
ncbi:MAG TPA: DUF4270 domain-containing protein [Lentimicrobium sp.]|nr:DUF4270 domain-containing protein [Lentimicrobium sp.]